MSHALTEVNAFTADVLVPDPGDDRKAASVEVPFQALANRTKNLKATLDGYPSVNRVWPAVQDFDSGIRIGDNGGPNEVGYTNPRTRIVNVPIVPIVAPAGWTCAPSVGSWVTAGSTRLTVFLSRDLLPGGATLQKVRAAASISDVVSMEVVRLAVRKSPPDANAPLGSPVTDSYTPTGTEVHILEASMAWVVDNAAELYRVTIIPSGTSNVALQWIDIEYDDPGPRNF